MATSKSVPAKKAGSNGKPTAKKPAAKKTPTASTKKPAASSKPATAKSTAKPAVKKTTARKPAAITSAAKKAAPAKTHTTPLSPEQRYRMVQEAAYYIAERNGFAGGALDYWIEAEAQISAMLSRGN